VLSWHAPAVRILVIDDYPGTAEAACILLRMLGHDCRPALTGAQAIGELASFEPDLVLVDLELPDIHGSDVAHHARELGSFVAVMSGHEPIDGTPRFADMFVTKPITLAGLRDVLAAAESRRAAGGGPDRSA
jgi:DNA-binding response OmpR family regulator